MYSNALLTTDDVVPFGRLVRWSFSFVRMKLWRVLNGFHVLCKKNVREMEMKQRFGRYRHSGRFAQSV